MNFYRDPAVFPVTAVTPATRKAKDTQYGAILRHISSIPCDPALAAFLFLSKAWVVDIQRGGELAVAEDTRYRCHIRTARDHQAGSGVAQAVDIELLSVDVPPLQGAALAAPHPRGNDKLKVCLILDALIFQCGDDFLRRFFVGNLFPCFLTCVARHGSGDRTPISMEYVFCCELRVSFMAGRLALPRLALEEEIDVPITGNVLLGNGFPVMSRFG